MSGRVICGYVIGRSLEIQATLLLGGICDRLPRTADTESDGQFQFYLGCIDMDVK